MSGSLNCGSPVRSRARVRLWLEIALTVASARLAILLLTDQGYFDRYPDAYRLLTDHWMASEWEWGTLAALACIMKSAAIIMQSRLVPKRLRLDLGTLRAVGWGLSAALWTCLCATTTWGEPASITSILTGLAAALCLVTLYAGPTDP